MVNCSVDPPIRPTVFILSIRGILTLVAILPHGIGRLQTIFLGNALCELKRRRPFPSPPSRLLVGWVSYRYMGHGPLL
jgi:hypothetical protein